MCNKKTKQITKFVLHVAKITDIANISTNKHFRAYNDL